MRLGKTERTAARKLVRELLALPDRNNLAKGMGVSCSVLSRWMLRRHLPAAKSQAKIRLYLDSLQKQPPTNHAQYTSRTGRIVRVQFAPQDRIPPAVDCIPSFAVPEPATKWSRRATWLLTLLRPERQRLVLEHAYLQLKLQQEENEKALAEWALEQRGTLRQAHLQKQVDRQMEMHRQARVALLAENHVTADPDTPIKDQGVRRSFIRIEAGCWIGAGAIILCGVSVGDLSVIGAGSVVTEDVPSGSVVCGVPARVIRHIEPLVTID